jgi:hypothetical protein
VGGDGGRGGIGGVAGLRGGTRPRSDQVGGIGVEAEADLAAALFYERRKPIREGLQEALSRL